MYPEAESGADLRRSPSERSDVRSPPDPYALLTPRELADLAEAATRRGYADVARDLRARNNAEVREQSLRVERDTERTRADRTSAQLSDAHDRLRRRRRAIYALTTSVLTLAATVVGLIANRLAAPDVATTAETAATEVVEQRAAPIEQRADEAAEAAKAAATRQAELERRESARAEQLERLINALEAERAAPAKGKAHK